MKAKKQPVKSVDRRNRIWETWLPRPMTVPGFLVLFSVLSAVASFAAVFLWDFGEAGYAVCGSAYGASVLLLLLLTVNNIYRTPKGREAMLLGVIAISILANCLPIAGSIWVRPVGQGQPYLIEMRPVEVYAFLLGVGQVVLQITVGTVTLFVAMARNPAHKSVSVEKCAPVAGDGKAGWPRPMSIVGFWLWLVALSLLSASALFLLIDMKEGVRAFPGCRYGATVLALLLLIAYNIYRSRKGRKAMLIGLVTISVLITARVFGTCIAWLQSAADQAYQRMAMQTLLMGIAQMILEIAAGGAAYLAARRRDADTAQPPQPVGADGRPAAGS